MRFLIPAVMMLFATASRPAASSELNVIAIEMRTQPGVPEALEESITLPIEKAVYRVPRLKGMRSTTSHDRVRIELAYAGSPTPDDVLQVERAFAGVRGVLPASASEPLIEVQASRMRPR